MERTTTMRAGALLGVLAPAVLLVALTSDMVAPVLPGIGRRYGAGEAELAWVVTGFLLVFAVGIPLHGRVSDVVGLRRQFGASLVVYLAGSVVCATAPGLAVLVAGRVVMGAGAAALPVLSVVAISRLLPPDRHATGIGVISAAGGVGTALGPAVGGGVGGYLGWPALFWLTVGYGALLLAGALRVLPDDAPGGSRRFDVTGGLALGLTAALLLLGVTEWQVSGPAAPACWGAFALAVLAAAVFVRRTAVAADPFVPRSLFADGAYRRAVLTVFLAMAANLSVLAFVPVMLVATNGLGAGAASLAMVPGGIALAVLAPVAGRVAGRIGVRTVTACGLLVMGASAFALSVVAGGSPWAVSAGVLGIGAGFGIVVTTVTTTAAAALPAERAGVGLGLFQGAQFLGAGAGPALAGALLAARRETGQAALNPWHDGPAAPFSDAFLAASAVLLAAVVVTVAAARGAQPVSASSAGRPAGVRRKPR